MQETSIIGLYFWSRLAVDSKIFFLIFYNQFDLYKSIMSSKEQLIVQIEDITQDIF